MRILVFTNMYPFERMPFYGSFVSDEVECLREAGVEVDVLFINGKTSKLNYLASPLRMFSCLRSKHYDIIHVHHSFCGFVAVWQKNTPIVWTFHEGEISGTSTQVREERFSKPFVHSKAFKRYVARQVDSVIVVADFLKGPLGREDASTIPAGVNTALFQPQDRGQARRELGLDMDKLYVLFPSAPTRPGKRYELARAVVERLPEDLGPVQLIALDDVPHDTVPLFMNASDVMLMTSAFEASPVTVREALACNLAVVSTDVGDVSTFAHHSPGCVVVGSSDPGQLAERLETVLRSPKPADGTWVRQECSLQATTRKVIEVYRNVIDRRKAQRQ